MSREEFVQDYAKLMENFERELSEEMEQMSKKAENGDDEKGDDDAKALSMDTIIKYLNDNQSVLETKMNDHDRKHMENALKITKDMKSLAKEAISALKIDLMSFYNFGKSTFSVAISEFGISKSFLD